MESAYFRNIRNPIISCLNDSKNEVRVAVAWFTNQDLFDTLLECLNRNVKTSLIIINDYINNGDFGLDFNEFINRGGLLYYGKEENPMHHKICIVDKDVLFTGSYNWTYYAENKNIENVIRIENNEKIIEQYIGEYDNLKSQLEQVNQVHKITFEEFELKNYFSIRNYLGLDLVYHGKETSEVKYFIEAEKLIPNNHQFLKEFQSFLPITVIETTQIPSKNSPPIIDATKPKPKVTKNSIGIKSRIKGINGRFSIIVAKSSLIPCESSHKYFTVEDNQTEMSIETFKGENNEAEKNFRLGMFLIKDLPKKPAGTANVTVTIQVNEKLDLIVKATSNDTGNQIEAVYYDKSIIE